MPRFAARRPYNAHQTPSQVAEADDAALAIVTAKIVDIEGEAREHFRGILEGKPTLIKAPVPLGRVEGDSIYVSTKNFSSNKCGYENDTFAECP